MTDDNGVGNLPCPVMGAAILSGLDVPVSIKTTKWVRMKLFFDFPLLRCEARIGMVSVV